MHGMRRLTFRFFAVALIMLSFASCGGDTDVERIGAMEISEQGTLIQWYAIGADIGEAELRAAADAELKGLGLDRRVELIFFRDRSMAESFAKAEEDREEIELGFFDPTVALATSGGALIIRDAGSDPVWNWFPAPGEVK
jgi:hypothetical protein